MSIESILIMHDDFFLIAGYFNDIYNDPCHTEINKC